MNGKSFSQSAGCASIVIRPLIGCFFCNMHSISADSAASENFLLFNHGMHCCCSCKSSTLSRILCFFLFLCFFESCQKLLLPKSEHIFPFCNCQFLFLKMYAHALCAQLYMYASSSVMCSSFPYPFDCIPQQMEYIVLSCLHGSSGQGSFRNFTQSDVLHVFSEAPIGGF